MPLEQPAGFIEALYAALDAQRRAREINWQQATREINALFGHVPARPISPSTLTGMRSKAAVDGDGVLQMLRWLNRTPESFVPGYQGADAEAARLPDIGSHQILRFDTRKLHSALDTRRTERKMTWTQVAQEIGGLNAASLTRLSKGGRIGFPEVIRIAGWLGGPVACFTHASDR